MLSVTYMLSVVMLSVVAHINAIKTIILMSHAYEKSVRVLVLEKHFHPSLMFMGKPATREH